MSEIQVEMDSQEMSFLSMSKELNIVASGEKCAIQMFLKYTPESLHKLFDRCIIKPCFAQVMYFLFSSNTQATLELFPIQVLTELNIA